MPTSYGFLVCASVDLSVVTEGFSELEREHGGSDRRMFDQTLRSFRKAEKLAWRCTLYWPTEADYQAFRTALGAAGTTVPLTGSALSDVSYDVKVTIADAPYAVSEGGLGFTRACSAVFRQV